MNKKNLSDFKFNWQLSKELVTPFLALRIQNTIGLPKNIVSKMKPAIGSDDENEPAKKKTLVWNRESVSSSLAVLLILNKTVSAAGCGQNARSVEILCPQPMKSTVILRVENVKMHQARCIQFVTMSFFT